MEICGKIFSVARCVCVLRPGHAGQHLRDPNERKEMRRLGHRRFYAANREKLVAKGRRYRQHHTVYKTIIKTIKARERSWNLRLQGKILRMDGHVYPKPLGRGELAEVQMELERCADRRRRAPATAFLRLPVIA
jgi:hypothetical protein